MRVIYLSVRAGFTSRRFGPVQEIRATTKPRRNNRGGSRASNHRHTTITNNIDLTATGTAIAATSTTACPTTGDGTDIEIE
nr:hypothetical protein BaRGS_021410 [Batillaria attramentaria]